MKAGTRTPPSKLVILPERSGQLLPAKPPWLEIEPPLSEE